MERLRVRPVTAGLITGALGGAAMLAALGRLLLHRGGSELAPRACRFLARAVHAAPLEHPWPIVVGFGGAALAGAIVGALFAIVTMRLRRWGALLVWSMVFFPSVVVAFHAFVLPRVLPHLRADLPIVQTLIASLAYAFVVSLTLPLRLKKSDNAWEAQLSHRDLADAGTSL